MKNQRELLNLLIINDIYFEFDEVYSLIMSGHSIPLFVNNMKLMDYTYKLKNEFLTFSSNLEESLINSKNPKVEHSNLILKMKQSLKRNEEFKDNILNGAVQIRCINIDDALRSFTGMRHYKDLSEINQKWLVNFFDLVIKTTDDIIKLIENVDIESIKPSLEKTDQDIPQFEKVRIYLTAEELGFLFKLLIDLKIFDEVPKNVNKANLSKALISVFKTKGSKSEDCSVDHIRNKIKSNPEGLKYWEPKVTEIRNLIIQYKNEQYDKDALKKNIKK